jgi:regulatory protein
LRSRAPRTLKARAIALLARREYGRAELRQRLLAGSTRDEDTQERKQAVDAVLDELAAAGLLSDERYARAVVTSKAGSYSRRSIAQSLKAQGVAGDTVSQALAANEVDDEVAMLALWQRRFGHAPADEREKARQVRFLQTRGFSLSAIFRLLRGLPSAAADE